MVVAAYGLNFAVKLAVRRRRPELPGLAPLTPTVSNLSFPSAHCTTSFAAARAYAGLAPTPALYAAATAFALSRPYLGVHYPSDVLAGAGLGTLLATVWPPRPSVSPPPRPSVSPPPRPSVWPRLPSAWSRPGGGEAACR